MVRLLVRHSYGAPRIWFEVESVSPSPTISFGLPGHHLVYDLYSVIYLGKGHFNAHMRNSPGEWWNYDGTRKFGVARSNRIQVTGDFLFDEPRDAAFFIYRRSDC